ncbi:MAG: FHA domain-containing protein [Chloroflexi bacterium]|nr:MAG: FHA domain-containing protein [Chloroflexota bacterium]
MARLTMRRGPYSGRVYQITKEVTTLGRGNKNHIIIEDYEVSRHHCRFIQVMNDYEIHDLGSVNGTFINGQRLEGSRLLRTSCLIELGNSITFEYDPEHTETQPDGDTQPEEKHPYLVVVRGTDPEVVFKLTDETYTIGRDLANDIVIQDPEVSRRHVKMQKKPQGYLIEDVGSTNGTWLNGTRLSVAEQLHPGDIIKLGAQVRLHYTMQPSDVRHKPAPIDFKAREDTDEYRVQFQANDTDTLKRNIIGSSVQTKTSKLGTGLLPGVLENHVFIAYSRADWQVVAPMVMYLQDAKIDVWTDQYLTEGSKDWMAAVEQALRECWLMVVVVSPTAMRERQVRLKHHYFYNREKPIISLIYRPVPQLPENLKKSRQKIPFDKDNPEKVYKKLIFEIMHNRR